MEIRYAVIVFGKKFPDLERAAAVGIERSVDKLHLTGFCVKKNLQIGKNLIERSIAKRHIACGKAVRASKRTAARAFVI